MDTVKTVTLIETTLTRRGSGADSNSPVRVITQYWDAKGNLVCEIDPCAVTFTPETIAHRIAQLVKFMEAHQDRLNQETIDQIAALAAAQLSTV